MMNQKKVISRIKAHLEPLQLKLDEHPINDAIHSVDKAIVFMEHHIFSVWDFMNILKSLQHYFTCVTVPWAPVQSPELARLVNEIVLEEESDIINGVATSHFMYYVHALSEISHSSMTELFLADLKKGLSYESLIQSKYIPYCARRYLNANYHCIVKRPMLEVAAVFAFGRECLIPRLFTHLLLQFKTMTNPVIANFVTYLERHIDLDEEHHGPLAEKMVLTLLSHEGDVDVVERVAHQALNARLLFWDGIFETINK